MLGNLETCSRCGSLAQVESGHFEIKDGLITIVRQVREALKEASLEDLERVRRVAADVASGEAVDARSSEAAISEWWSALILWAKEWQILPLIIAIITLHLTLEANKSSNATDAVMTQQLRQQTQLMQQMTDSLRAIQAAGSAAVAPEYPKPKKEAAVGDLYRQPSPKRKTPDSPAEGVPIVVVSAEAEAEAQSALEDGEGTADPVGGRSPDGG